jgi:two-component system, chemotaxis family, sensor kinase CheA
VTGIPNNEEFLAGFVVEAQEHLATARRATLAVEEALRRGHPGPRATRELFRALHTLKGLSGMIGAEPIVDLAHEMEAVVRAGDRAGGRLRQDALDAVVKGIAAMEERVERVARREPIPPAPPALLEALGALESAPRPSQLAATDLPPQLAAKLGPAEMEQLAEGIAAGRRAVQIEFAPSPERAARGFDVTAARERVNRIGEIVKVLPRRAAPEDDAPAGLVFVLLVLSSAPDAELAAAVEAPVDSIREIHLLGGTEPGADRDDGQDGEERSPLAGRAFVRVAVSRLDEALEGVSALLVSRSRLVRGIEGIAAGGADVRALAPILVDHARELRRLRAAVMRARLVRLSDVLERAPLLVRGLERSSGKQVRLALEVGDAEVDKAVGERLFPAVVHLVRNAVDHAIEPPAERRRAGKPEGGTIRIAAAPRGEGQLEIVVSDDGAGIDVQAVARKARAPVPRTGREILDLIATAGLSTLESPTRTSGRGIGMDVVRRIVVSELGGSLEVSTAPAVGTTFTLRVPLSLSIVDGLAFECAGETYVVPIAAIDELVEIDPSLLVGAPAQRGRGTIRMLRWREESVPYVELRHALGLAREGAGRRAIIVRTDGVALGFGVDRMIGRQEVVIRPVTDPLVERVGVAGATDLGDGRPTLVLDLAALSRALQPTVQEHV